MTAVTDTSSVWQVYILECGDGSLYTGITRDVAERIITHNQGTGAKYTRGRLPVRLVYAEPADNRATALRRELAIKKLSRARKLWLIHSSTSAH
jgi:putative endonuclease